RAPSHPERVLAVADPEQVDALTAPLVGHGCTNPEPVGRPQRPEPVSQLCWAVVERLDVGRVDALAGPGDEQPIRVANVRVDLGTDPVAHLGNAIAGVAGVAQHARTTLPSDAVHTRRV